MTIRIDEVKGLRNDVSSERFNPGDLVSASNIDIDDDGRPSRRDGISRQATGSTASLWSDGNVAYFTKVTSDEPGTATLAQLNADYSSTDVLAGVNNDVYYTSVNGSVYWTDNSQSGVLFKSANRKLGITPPEKIEVAASSYGQFPAGRYGITSTFIRKSTVESGALEATYIDLPANSGLSLVNLAASTDADIIGRRIYMTRPDGRTLYAAGTYDDGLTTIGMTTVPKDTMYLRTQFKSPLPAGNGITYFAGHLYVTVNNHIFFSDPMEFELCDQRSSFLSFPDPVTLVAPMDQGMFVGTTKEIVYLSGRNPEQFVSTPVANYGAIPGTLTYPPVDKAPRGENITGKVALWLTENGVCVGLSSGQMINATSDRYDFDAGSKAAGLFKIKGSATQYLVSLFN